MRLGGGGGGSTIHMQLDLVTIWTREKFRVMHLKKSVVLFTVDSVTLLKVEK